jgi:hypothetical protein
VCDLARLEREAGQAGLDEAGTVAHLVETLGGEVRGWRPGA